MRTRKNIFGAGCDHVRFLRRYWQKKPFAARETLSEFAAGISRAELFALAADAHIESRIVVRERRKWRVEHGPFSKRDLARMPRAGWTLLVQGVDQVLPSAASLLRAFSFIPYARLDDVMVSYAAPGGGVGPHFDSYDVFLVQVEGERRWRVSRPRDLELVPDLPLKILKRFAPEHEWNLRPGDLLYVPPQWPHDGVAIDECITCSVGFRAPSAQELASRFFDFLQDELDLDSMYRDPDLRPTLNPARIDDAMVRRLRAMLERVRWSTADMERFIGSYLSEPKPNVVFEHPQPRLSLAAFERSAHRDGLTLALATRMLYRGKRIFLNGEVNELHRDSALLRTLADEREVTPRLTLSSEPALLLYDWYSAGYIRLGSSTRSAR